MQIAGRNHIESVFDKIKKKVLVGLHIESGPLSHGLFGLVCLGGRDRVGQPLGQPTSPRREHETATQEAIHRAVPGA